MALFHPESDLSLNIVAHGADVLRFLHKQHEPVIGDDLLEDFLRRDNRRTPSVFFAALDFLYSLGAIRREGYRIVLDKSESQ